MKTGPFGLISLVFFLNIVETFPEHISNRRICMAGPAFSQAPQANCFYNPQSRTDALIRRETAACLFAGQLGQFGHMSGFCSPASRADAANRLYSKKETHCPPLGCGKTIFMKGIPRLCTGPKYKDFNATGSATSLVLRCPSEGA